MQNVVIDALIPHYCCSCGEIGSIFCSCCKYDIISEPYAQCIICRKPTASNSLCATCPSPIKNAWCITEYSDSIKKLIEAYKFERSKAAHVALADLLDEALPQLPENVTIVPVPTVASHIRVRGYDHAALVAKRFARKRKIPYTNMLQRQTSDCQRGASRSRRHQQASKAFKCSRQTEGIYLLIDDITTTGATLHYTAIALYDAGASEVWAAVIARQPLEK